MRSDGNLSTVGLREVGWTVAVVFIFWAGGCGNGTEDDEMLDEKDTGSETTLDVMDAGSTDDGMDATSEADGNDTTSKTAAQVQLGRVGVSGSAFLVRQTSTSTNLTAVITGESGCNRIKSDTRSGAPTIAIRTNGVEAGTYDIKQSAYTATGDAALVSLYGIDGESAGASYDYGAISGTVELKENAMEVDSKLDMEIEAEFPSSLIGGGVCESSSTSMDAGESEPVCDCKQYRPEEEYMCTQSEPTAPCCFDESRYNGITTLTVEEATFLKCESSISPDAGPSKDGGRDVAEDTSQDTTDTSQDADAG